MATNTKKYDAYKKHINQTMADKFINTMILAMRSKITQRQWDKASTA